MSWSLSNPPLKADGSLDYQRLTPRQICEDLTETLLDLVENAGQEELIPFLNDLPDADRVPATGAPRRPLVEAMETLLRLEGSDTCFRSSEVRAALATAVRELLGCAAA